MRLRSAVVVFASGLVLCLGLAAIVSVATAAGGDRRPAPLPTRASASASPTPSALPYVAPTAAQIAALPEAKYNAVIPGLLPLAKVPAVASTFNAYSLAVDTPIYGADRTVPVARFASNNFLNAKSVIVPVRFDGPWALVLTPSRQFLPSQDQNNAPAQTAGWVRASALTKVNALPQRIVVSVSAQTLAIVNQNGSIADSFAVGVGTDTTPTPTGVTGYLQARYLDPSQGQSVYPIQLTSLHSSAADNPYGGTDGGLIGIHYEAVATGDVSHGCVRMPAASIAIVNTLPLGTLVSIEP